jgi:hypothetical protein
VGDAEVGDEGASALPVEQDVVGLHVPVHDPAGVRVGERPADLAHDPHDLRRRQGAAALAQPVGQRPPST